MNKENPTVPGDIHYDRCSYFERLLFIEEEIDRLLCYTKREVYPEIRAKLKEIKGKKFIVCEGEKDYCWFAWYSSLKSTMNRVGRYESLEKVIGGAVKEYCLLSKNNEQTLKFDVIPQKAIKEWAGPRGFDINDNTVCGYNSKFFKDHKNLSKETPKFIWGRNYGI